METTQESLDQHCAEIALKPIEYWVGDDNCGSACEENRHPHADCAYEDCTCDGPDSAISQVLDIRYVLNQRGELLGAHLLMAFGGPNIWADTQREEVRGAWGFATSRMEMRTDICNQINERLEELPFTVIH